MKYLKFKSDSNYINHKPGIIASFLIIPLNGKPAGSNSLCRIIPLENKYHV